MTTSRSKTAVLGTILGLMSASAFAGEADILAVDITVLPNGAYRFDVTVRHDDTGWDHYTDAFEVVASGGAIMGKRILAHPHENEQPFTRSLTVPNIAPEYTQVIVRAHDSVHGVGGLEMKVDLPHK